MIELWKPVVGFEDIFEVSSFGQVYSKRTNKILKQHLNKSGYVTVTTKIGGRKGFNKCFKVHRLVAEAFIDNTENKPYVNHINGVKSSNNVDNLEWCTASENTDHAIAKGLISYKDRKYKRVLNRDQIDYIIANYKPRCRTFGARALARKFNVSKDSILYQLTKSSTF